MLLRSWGGKLGWYIPFLLETEPVQVVRVFFKRVGSRQHLDLFGIELSNYRTIILPYHYTIMLSCYHIATQLLHL